VVRAVRDADTPVGRVEAGDWLGTAEGRLVVHVRAHEPGAPGRAGSLVARELAGPPSDALRAPEDAEVLTLVVGAGPADAEVDAGGDTQLAGVLGPEWGITPAEALRLYTTGSAYCSFDETRRGSLEPGKLADLVVLGADPLRVNPDEIASIPIEQTLVGGRVVFGDEVP